MNGELETEKGQLDTLLWELHGTLKLIAKAPENRPKVAPKRKLSPFSDVNLLASFQGVLAHILSKWGPYFELMIHPYCPKVWLDMDWNSFRGRLFLLGVEKLRSFFGTFKLEVEKQCFKFGYPP